MSETRVETAAPVEEVHTVPFQCVHCGHQAAAQVRVPTQAPSFIASLLGPRTRQEAAIRARETAVDRAHRVAATATCPACKKVDPRAVGAEQRGSLDRAIVTFAVVTGVGFIVFQAAYPFLPFILGAGLAVYQHLNERWLWTEAGGRVTFLEAGSKKPLKGPQRPVRLTSPWDWTGPLALAAVVGGYAYWVVANQEFMSWLSGRFNWPRPDNDNTVQWGQFALAGFTLWLLAWGYALARQGRAAHRQVLRDRLLVVVGLSGFLAYFNFGHLHYGNFVHVWDTYHYVMGAKYFPELGYDKLYDCAAVADAESGRKDELLRRTMTDLRTNLMVRTDDVIANPGRCKEDFSPQRWQAFRADIDAFHSFVNEGRWREIHQDHGYNATPVWTLAGMALANASGPVTFDKLKQLNLLDPLYLVLTVLMVWWAFGPRGFAIAALTLGTNFANRYYWTGGAFLRHDWVFYLVAAICLLKKDRPFLSGMAFSYATLLRLFPGLVAFGPLLAAVEYFRVHRAVDPRFMKWVAGGVVATVALVGASFALFEGPTTWQRFAQNTIKHANTPLTNHMGLRTVLSWRPATTGQAMQDNTQIDAWAKWKATRLEKYRDLKPLFFLLLGLAGLMVYLAIRATTTEPWFAAALGVGFIVFGAELTNYYYCFLMGIAVLHVKRREVGMILAALAMVTQFVNWSPLVWMSRWLDEQYVAMSIASVFAMVGIWWLFTRWGHEAAVEPEPEPMLALAGAPSLPAVAQGPAPAGKKGKSKRK